MCCCRVLNVLCYGSKLTKSVCQRGPLQAVITWVIQQSSSLPCTTWLTRSVMHRSRRKALILHTLWCGASCCVVAIKGTSSEGGKGLLERGAADYMPAYWINAVGGQQNWDFCFYSSQRYFFCTFTIHISLK